MCVSVFFIETTHRALICSLDSRGAVLIASDAFNFLCTYQNYSTNQLELPDRGWVRLVHSEMVHEAGNKQSRDETVFLRLKFGLAISNTPERESKLGITKNISI